MLFKGLKYLFSLSCLFLALLFFCNAAFAQYQHEPYSISATQVYSPQEISLITSHPSFTQAVLNQQAPGTWWNGWSPSQARSIDGLNHFQGCPNCWKTAQDAFNQSGIENAALKQQAFRYQDQGSLNQVKGKEAADQKAEKKLDEQKKKLEEECEEQKRKEQRPGKNPIENHEFAALSLVQDACDELEKLKENESAKEKKLEEVREKFIAAEPSIPQLEEQLFSQLQNAKGANAAQVQRTVDNFAQAKDRLALQAGGDYDVLGDLSAYDKYAAEYKGVLDDSLRILNSPEPTRYELNGAGTGSTSRASLVEQFAFLTADPTRHSQGASDSCAWCKPLQKNLLQTPSTFTDFVAQTTFSDTYLNPFDGRSYNVPYSAIAPGAGERGWTYNSGWGLQSPAARNFVFGGASIAQGSAYRGSGGATNSQVAWLDKFFGGDGTLGQYYSPTEASALSLTGTQNLLSSGQRDIVVIGDPFGESGGIQDNHVTAGVSQWALDANGEWQRVGAHVGTWKGTNESFKPIEQVNLNVAPGGGGAPAWAFENISNLLNNFPFFGMQNLFSPQQAALLPQVQPTPNANAENTETKDIDSLSSDSQKDNINDFFDTEVQAASRRNSGDSETESETIAAPASESSSSQTTGTSNTDVNGIFSDSDSEDSSSSDSSSDSRTTSTISSSGNQAVNNSVTTEPIVVATPILIDAPSNSSGEIDQFGF